MSEMRWHRLAIAGLVAILLGNAIGVAFGAGLEWDFANFYIAGQKVHLGETANLYDEDALVGGEPPLSKMLFVSTPLSAAFYTPLAWFPPTVGLRIFKLFNALALLSALWLLLARARDSIPPAERTRFAALFAAATLAYQPLWTIYMVGGQTTPFILLLLVLALDGHARGRLAQSAICLVVAVVIKPVVAPALALVAITSGWRFFWISAAAGAGALGLSVAAFGWPVHAAFLEVIASFSGNSVSWVFNSGLTTPLESIRVGSDHTFSINPRDPLLSSLIDVGRVAISLGLAWLVYLAFRPDVSESARRRFLLHAGIVFTLAIAPVVWEHYLMLLVPTLVALSMRWDRLPQTARGAIVIAIGAAPFQNLLVTLTLWDASEGLPAAAHFCWGVVKALPLLATIIAFVASARVMLERNEIPRSP